MAHTAGSDRLPPRLVRRSLTAAAIEKTFEGGREALAHLGIPVESLARITAMDDDRIVFNGE